MTYNRKHRPGDFCLETGNYNEITPVMEYDHQDMPRLYKNVWCRVGEVMPETSTRYLGQRHIWKLVSKDERDSTITASTLNHWKENSEHLSKMLQSKEKREKVKNNKLFLFTIVLVGLLTIFLVSRSFAQGGWWYHKAQIYVSQTVVEAAFTNNSDRPIYCEGTVFGQTYYGKLLKNYSAGVVYPNGGVGGIFVYTNMYDPFVNGWANIQCTTNF